MQKEPLVIYGDGNKCRDFLYVADLVEAIVLADSAETPGKCFQIASGRETSIRTTARYNEEGSSGLVVRHSLRALEGRRNFPQLREHRKGAPDAGLRSENKIG